MPPSQQQIQQALKETTEALQKQLDTFRMTGDQVKQYELRMMGATEAQLKQVDALQKQVNLLKEQKNLAADTKDRWQDYRSTTQQVIGTLGDLTKASQGSYAALGSAAQGVGGLVAKIPIPMAQAVGGALSIVGDLIGAMGAEADRFRQRSVDAFMAAATGAKNFRQSVQDVQLDTLSAGLRRATEAMAGGGNFLQSAGMWAVRQIPFLPPQAQAGIEVNVALAQARQQEENLLRLRSDPTLTAGRTLLATMQFTRVSGDIQEQARTGELVAGARARALRGGATPQEAGLAMQEMQRVAQHALAIQRSGESFADAIDRVRAAPWIQQALQAEGAARRNQLAAEATAELEEQNRQGRLNVQVQQLQLSNIRAQRDTLIPVVDQSRELVELQQMRLRGASAEAIQARQVQLAAEQQAQHQLDLAQYGSQVVAQNRTAAETYRMEQARLLEARHAGEISDTAFFREQGRLFRGLAQAADMARLPALLEEGSVAAAVAVQRAEQEQVAADPNEIPNILRSIENLGRAQVEYGRRVWQALQQPGAQEVGINP